MEIFVESIGGFDIHFEALEEFTSLKELLPEESDEQLKEIYNNNAIFCAKVTAKKNGIALASDYLGGCIYESEEDFYIKYKDDYFSEMVQTVINEAKETIKKLTE